jgi:hypothetical protein
VREQLSGETDGGLSQVHSQPKDQLFLLRLLLYSHGVRQRVATEVALNGFNSTVEIIKKTTDALVPKRQVEELAQTSSRDFNEFYDYLQAQSKQLEQTGEIIYRN